MILDIQFCDTNSRGLLLVTFLGKVFSFAKIIIPIILILMGTLDLVKAMAAGNDKIKETQKLLIKRIIIGIAIFLIPTLVLFILQILNQEQTKCLYCFLSPYEDTCEYIKPEKKAPIIEQPKKEEQKQEESKKDQNIEEKPKVSVDPETCKVHFSGLFITNNKEGPEEKVFVPETWGSVLNSGEYLIKEKNSQQIKELNPVFDQTFDSIAINENTKFQVYINDELKFEETGPKLITNSYYKNNTSQNDALYTIHEESRLKRCPEDETKRVSLAFKPSDNVLSDEYQFNILENYLYVLNSDYNGYISQTRANASIINDKIVFVISCTN